MPRDRNEAFVTVSTILLAEFCAHHHVDAADEIMVAWQQHCREREEIKPSPDDVEIILSDANWSYALDATARTFCDEAFREERKRC